MDRSTVKRDKRTQTCCFTGHRKIPHEQLAQTQKRLKETIQALIEKGVIYYGAGGALGFDTLAATTVLKMKEDYPEIKLILVLPCVAQADWWDASDREVYEEIKQMADNVVYTSQEYTRGCMHKRNRHLVDNSSICICYLTDKTGGTAYTVGYAKSAGVRVINLADDGSEI
jgi:uncharacterized phage-like protein YoqJ